MARWAIVNIKTGEEKRTLGWYSNASREEVIRHAENNGIEIDLVADKVVVVQWM